MRALDERYSVNTRIGRGGMGEVYEGLQVALDRRVAIKVLRPEYTANHAAVGRFLREARALSRLRHPNVVTVFDVGQTGDGAHYLVMELLEGQTLAGQLRKGGPMALDEALEISAQIVRGMGAGQGVGLVHRDLKPENLFLGDDRLVKILDFGLALLRETGAGAPLQPPEEPGGHSMSDAETRTPWSESHSLPTLLPDHPKRVTSQGSVVGTPRYMAPEQALGWQVDHRADIYAFGCIFFEMLAGHPPFEAPTAQAYLEFHVHAAPPGLDLYLPEAPEALVALVAAMLSKDPARRPQDWSSLAEELRRLQQLRADEGAEPEEAARAALPTEPYRFLQPFSPATRAIFFGRDADAARFRALWEHPDEVPLLLLTGASGVGKTSFLYARVVPQLTDTGHELITIRGGAEPMEAARQAVERQLARSESNAGAPPEAGPSEPPPLPQQLDALSAALRRPIAVVLDQIEELFTAGSLEDRAAFQAALASVVGGGDRSVRFILSVREDFLGPLIRALHPLPTDQLARTLALRPLGPDDIREALAGPSRPGLPVDYAPFHFEEGLVDRIVEDLTADDAGEVAPRIQAVGYRLWEMVRGAEAPTITSHHYTDRLGGARGIVGRVLDEAITDLDPRDRDLAKELLRALTHLPGSATSAPAPAGALVGDDARRRRVIATLEGQWRVIYGYIDPRWPGERTFRVAHEALIDRIRDYGEENSERNRARSTFQHGLALWLKNGRRDDDLLKDTHVELLLQHADDLVLASRAQHTYFEACKEAYNEGWYQRFQADRRARRRRRVRLVGAPMLLVGLGFVLGQAPADFTTLRGWGLRAAAAAAWPGMDLGGFTFRGVDLPGLSFPDVILDGADLSRAALPTADLSGARLRGADLGGADLRRADLSGADLTDAALDGTNLDGARLDGATLIADLSGASFSGARYDKLTAWPEDGPPTGAVGYRGRAPEVRLDGLDFSKLDVAEADLRGAHLIEASFAGSSLERAILDQARLDRAELLGADLTEASLVEAQLLGCDLAEARLDGADLRMAELARANLAGANLSTARLGGADLKSAFADARTRWPVGFDPAARGVIQLLPGAEPQLVSMAGVHLCHAYLPEIVLAGASFSKALLVETVFVGADLSRADLREADLSGARLDGASLVAADLRRAKFTAADLCDADLSDARIEGALWEGTVDCPGTIWPGGGERPRGVLTRE